MVITAMAVLVRIILGFILGLASPAVAAGPSGGQLIVTPNTLSFKVGPPPSVAAAEVTVQVMVPGHLPWRLTVIALGPLRTAEGSEIAAGQLTWQGSPGPVFVNGTLSANHPQFVARGEGPKVGVVRFFLKNHWDLAAGQYGQRLLFNLSSP
jgi:hypothetical protein